MAGLQTGIYDPQLNADLQHALCSLPFDVINLVKSSDADAKGYHLYQDGTPGP